MEKARTRKGFAMGWFKKKPVELTEWEKGQLHAKRAAWAIYEQYEFIDCFGAMPTLDEIVSVFSAYSVEGITVTIPRDAHRDFADGVIGFVDWLEAALSGRVITPEVNIVTRKFVV